MATDRSAERKSRNEYNRKNYDQLMIRVPSGGRKIIDQAAEQAGMKQSDFLRAAVMEKMDSMGFEYDESMIVPGSASPNRSADTILSMLNKLAFETLTEDEADQCTRAIVKAIGLMKQRKFWLDVTTAQHIHMVADMVSSTVLIPQVKEHILQRVDDLTDL
jgi:hypothetical protein